MLHDFLPQGNFIFLQSVDQPFSDNFARIFCLSMSLHLPLSLLSISSYTVCTSEVFLKIKVKYLSETFKHYVAQKPKEDHVIFDKAFSKTDRLLRPKRRVRYATGDCGYLPEQDAGPRHTSQATSPCLSSWALQRLATGPCNTLQWPLPLEKINCPLPLLRRRPNSELWPDYSSWDSLTHTVTTRDNLPILLEHWGYFCFVSLGPLFTRQSLDATGYPCNKARLHTLWPSSYEGYEAELYHI